MSETTVVITGATGMVGHGVLLECLDDSQIDKVIIVNRRKLDLEHSKLQQIIVPDFFNLGNALESIQDATACFFCLGVSSAGMNESDFTKYTYDLTLNFAKELLARNKAMTFCYVSGQGTSDDPTQGSMWKRVKGKTEQDLQHLGFQDAYMFRPGFIEPKRGIKSATKLYAVAIFIARPLFPILRMFKGMSTTSIILGRAMIQAGLHGFSKKVLEPIDINEAGTR